MLGRYSIRNIEISQAVYIQKPFIKHNKKPTARYVQWVYILMISDDDCDFSRTSEYQEYLLLDLAFFAVEAAETHGVAVHL